MKPKQLAVLILFLAVSAYYFNKENTQLNSFKSIVLLIAFPLLVLSFYIKNKKEEGK
jgi:cbb3-type cytochrome oxidase subunit 3